MTKYLPLAIFAICVVGCKKKIEIREVPVGIKNSWTEVSSFTGTEKVILSSATGANAVYFQVPFYFAEAKGIDPGSTTFYAATLPTNVDLRFPISPRFFAYPYNFNDTAIYIRSNANPISTPRGGYFNLRELDPSATKVQWRFSNLFKCMAINKNEVLLVSYENQRAAHPFTFYLFSIKVLNTYPYIDTFYTKPVVIPKTSVGGYVRYIQSINDYFLVEISDEGIYKIKQDGSFSRVYQPTIIDAFYEWQGKVYAHAEWDKVLVSTDNAESFQAYSGIPDFMTLSKYFSVKDSLVGTNDDNLYTLRWNNNNYSVRALKNDGLEGKSINGIEVLRDTVYLATTSGLFVKPLKTFFETKP